jgi:hypothetical protein
MKRLRTTGVLLALSLLATSGCAYKYTFRTGEPPAKEKTYTEWKHIGLWGWISSSPVNLDKACPEGVAEFGSYVSLPNWVCAVITAGLYSPRTAYAVPAAGKGV